VEAPELAVGEGKREERKEHQKVDNGSREAGAHQFEPWHAPLPEHQRIGEEGVHHEPDQGDDEDHPCEVEGSQQ
jgi:hypothetical protein